MIQIASAPFSSLEYARLSPVELWERIRARKAEVNAVILGHNYQRVEIQEVSDFLGDSLGLSQEAADTDADVIVFCGVHFMAETAKILSPDKTVLMPDLRAGCPMADFVSGEALRRLKTRYPDAAVVAYVNSTAEVKSESDICCTSANAVEVVNSLPRDTTVLFVPDRNLARYVAERAGRPLVIAGQEKGPVEPGSVVAWDGYCYVHEDLVLDELAAARKAHPEAKVVIHPEARSELLAEADFITSTSKMVDIAEQHDALIIGTERGLIDRLKQRFPQKTLIPLSGAAICGNMKMNTLAKLAWSLDHMRHEVVLDEEIRVRAERSLRRMLDLSGGWRPPSAEEAALEEAGLRPQGLRVRLNAKPETHVSDTPNLLPAGSDAPDFSAQTSDGGTVSLQDFRGEQAVLLMFYPKDDTPGCTRQMCAARDEAEAYRAADIARFGVNPGSLDSHQRFAAKYSLDFPLLVDADKRIAGAYGVLKENGGVARATFLINKQGQIVFGEPGAHSATKILEDLRG